MRLLLVEDDPLISRELRLRWEAGGWSVRPCGTLAEAGDAISQGSFDAVVLDLGMPDGDGVAWLKRLREVDSRTPVLVVTARDRVDDRVLGLRSGADDYLVKPFSPVELDARLESLVRRSLVARGEEVQFGRISWHGREGRAYAGDQPLDLSPREFEVLGLLMKHAPQLLPKDELGRVLAQSNIDLSETACEVYISRLRRKLAGTGATIRTHRGFGYVLQRQAEPVHSA